MQERPFRARLEREFQTRRDKNPRFSLRAFAAFLDVDHSTLSQILRGARRIPTRQMRAWAVKLGIERDELAAYVAAEHVSDPETLRRQSQLQHWTAEAMSIINEPAHWEIIRLCRTPEFRPDSRWIAAEIGGDTDRVNLAFSRLLRLRLLEVSPTGQWIDRTELSQPTESSFRKLALARIRQKAAEYNVRLGRTLR